MKQTAGDKRIAVAVLTQKISFGWAEYASETNERSKQVKMQTTENGLDMHPKSWTAFGGAYFYVKEKGIKHKVIARI